MVEVISRQSGESFKARYALVVTIETTGGSTDIYTPISAELEQEIEVVV